MILKITVRSGMILKYTYFSFTGMQIVNTGSALYPTCLPVGKFAVFIAIRTGTAQCLYR